MSVLQQTRLLLTALPGRINHRLASTSCATKHNSFHPLVRASDQIDDEARYPRCSSFSSRFTRRRRLLLVGSIVALGSAGFLLTLHNDSRPWRAFPTAHCSEAKFISREELKSHNGKASDRVWVSFRGKVYDITDFIASHPGGNKVLLAAGGDVEQYWPLYAFHYDSHVTDILDQYYLGDLDPKDIEPPSNIDSTGPYANEPQRPALLVPVAQKPFNAETLPSLIVDHPITPTDLFFIRNHLPVPIIDEDAYKLTVEGPLRRGPLSLNLGKLKQAYPPFSLTTTVVCAGNRRREMADADKRMAHDSNTQPIIKGLSWTSGAISTAEWKGVRLYDLLRDLLLPWWHRPSKADHETLVRLAKEAGIRHVQFEGYDEAPEGGCFGSSLPIEWALDPSMDVLLAYEMNGQTLNRDHGYPLRVVVPGSVGARQVKWLKRIVLSSEESPSYWFQEDYKLTYPSDQKIEHTKLPPILDYPVQSVICEPSDQQLLVNEGSITVKGYAFSGGGRGIQSVRVSSDSGKSWVEAELSPVSPPTTVDIDGDADDKENESIRYRHTRQWAWTLWQAEIPVSDDCTEVDLVCVARDSSNNTQPEGYAANVNVRGLLNNVWHRICVKLKPEDEE